jgi:signal peptidase
VESTAALGLALFGRRRWPRGSRLLRASRLLAVAYLVVLGAVLAATLLPVLIGWRPYLVTAAGASPELPAGSAVLADRDGMLAVSPGQQVVVHDPAHPGRLMARRVEAVRSGGAVVVARDARATMTLPAEAVVGRVRFRIPLLGLVARQPVGCAFLTLLAGLVMAVSRRRLRPRRRPAARRNVEPVLRAARGQ